jgi:hypothetical protein
MMIVPGFLVLALGAIAAVVALIVPPGPSTLRLSSHNATDSTTNASKKSLGQWPQNVFSKPLSWGITAQILSSVPSPPLTLLQKWRILSIIEGMEHAARQRCPIHPKAVTMKHYHDTSGPLIFEMSSTNTSFTGPMVAGMLRAIWEMILEYGGPASLFAMLLKEGADIGFFRFTITDPVV